MKVNGRFPTHFEVTSLQRIWRRPPDVPYFQVQDDRSRESMVLSATATAIQRDAFNFPSYSSTASYPQTYFGPFACTILDSRPIPLPIPRKQKGNVVRFKHENFEERKRQGEILVGPYRNVVLDVNYHAGYVDSNVSSIGPMGGKDLPLTGLFGKPSSWASFNTIPVSVNEQWAGRGRLHFKTCTRDYSITPHDVGWDDESLEYLANLPIEYDRALVAETLAEANMGTLDILTAMAEMPETLRSIYVACKHVLNMYREAKRKEVRLYNRAKGGGFKANSKKSAIELADAVADVWLQFRYAIMPNVMLIEDALKLNDAFERLYERWRGTSDEEIHHNISLPHGWVASTDTLPGVTARCFIKRGFSQRSALGDVLGANLFVTAWELVPLSFVIDWVLNVGNMLASISIPNDSFVERATYSWKYDSSIIFTHEASKASVSVNIKGYHRNVISPSELGFFAIRPDFSPYRQLDAMALSWNMFVKKLVT